MSIQIAPESRAAVQGNSEYADMLTAQAGGLLRKVKWHLHPWKDGTWVSVSGVIYQGNGGNEREEDHWAGRGPWLLMPEHEVEDITAYDRRTATAATKRADALAEDIAALVTKHGIEVSES
jgi:hypothetical protein